MSRVTEPKILEVKLLDNNTYKVRALTLKEKKEYLKIIEKLLALKDKEVGEVAREYVDLQIEVAHFLLSRLQPNITKKQVGDNLEGSVFAAMVGFAFQDPFMATNSI